ncbi:MAG: GMC family oxidoreductase N-terminal domain-containing protein [Micromonosporaceae bacterium]|nr:GMC family oxidoreductase N-terminal domain-containing protein [Micromonosporaceae bacterium]
MRDAWDYVIVGAGSAGATLAARLSEDPAVRVLLLEAGPDFRSKQTPPGFQTRQIDMSVASNPEFWWPKLTARRNPVQEPYLYLRGRGVGGSSTVNGLCAIRGMPEDFDGWAAAGATGWSFAEVLPDFIRLEDEHDYPDKPYHGTGGPVPIYREPQTGWGGMDLAFAEAVQDSGSPWCDDHNAPDSTGLSPFAMNIRDGIRVSTNDGYLEPARDRSNLEIRGGAQVDTLVFAQPASGGSGGRTVTGVRLVGGETVQLEPGGEVVVACGSAHSPAVLMRSGIGPADELAALGIKCVADLPVGRGLQEHAMLMIQVNTKGDLKRPVDGRVTNCILRYSSGLGGAGRNDMMLLPNNGSPRLGPGVLMIAQQEQVFSRGSVTLVSADASVDPFIDQRLLTDERDVVRMRDAVRRIGDLLAHPALRALVDGPVQLPKDEDLPRIIGDTVHLAGTCRMGSPDDPATVVDPDCRVLGLDGLRVIDASVCPTVPRANIHLSVVMIAEHMAASLTR